MASFFSRIALGATLAASAIAGPLSLPSKFGPLTVFQELGEVPSQWVSQGPSSSDTRLQIQIGLKQENIAALEEKLMDISNPASPNYGKWLSKAEVDAITAPSAVNIALVKAWLEFVGITDVSQPSPDWIDFTAPVSKVETLLDAKYESFFLESEQRAIPRTTKYSIPLLLHPIIDMITPTTAFYRNIAPHVAPQPKASSVQRRAPTCASNAITPSCINSIYNVDYKSTGSQLVASTEFIEVAASHSDYEIFGQDYVPGLKDFKDVSVSGGSNPGSGNENTLLEGNLDTQYIGGLAYPNPSEYLSVGPTGNDFTDEIANFASYLTSTSTPPSSVSTSYGGEEQGFSASYLNRVCNEFMKAGSRGISVFFSSGDYGVGGNDESSCNQGFYALWPATCPYSTAVGGTQFDGNSEVVAQFTSVGGSSGGGFSYNFAAPSYQSTVVSSYVVSLGSTYKGYYNPSGRGYPDVALVSEPFQIIINGGVTSVLGTSCSSPSWAALVSVLNDYRYSKGEANLGFLNPLLYSANMTTALRDVTSGRNPGCNSNGFSAAKGWDPTTGLGSLDFGKFRALI